MPELTYVELFAGAGGLSRGLEAAGFRAVAHAEIDPSARAVLRYQWPTTRLDGDVTQIDGRQYDGITLLSGGSPCTDLSVAGRRAGLAGSQSRLFHEQVRIWQESNAPYFLWENVYGALTSNKGRDFAAVLSTLVGSPIPEPTKAWRRGGVAAGSHAVAAWRVLDLQHFGPPQRRLRVFVVASRTGGCDPAEILALHEGGCGHPSPRDQKRAHDASRLGGGASRSRGYTITNSSNRAGWFTEDIIGTVCAGGHNDGAAFQHGVLETEAHVITQTNTEALPALTASLAQGPTGHNRDELIIAQSTQAKAYFDTEVAFTLNTMHDQQYIKAPAARPRRLTPLECERLQGWPDHHTKFGTKEDGTVYELSDSARYRLCGNGVGSVCVQWIGERLAAGIQQQMK